MDKKNFTGMHLLGIALMMLMAAPLWAGENENSFLCLMEKL